MQKLILLLLLAGSCLATGQSVVPVLLGSGTGNGSLTNARIFWSLGELSVATLTSPANQITQGFWQPDLAKFTGTNAPLQVEYGITCLPNPVSDALLITFDSDKPVRLALFSVEGRLLYEEPSVASGYVLPIASWPAALYVLQFATTDGAWILTQKIVKQ